MSVIDEIILRASPGVYEPAEDSELLAEQVARDAGVRGIVLDVGTGSGLQAIVAARKRGVARVVATDVNAEALKLAAENAAANDVGKKIIFVESDLFARVPHKKFNCIIFNSPYLPTAKKERVRGALNAAFDGGGAKGRRVTDRFLREVKRFIAPNGVLLLVQSSLSDYEKTMSFLEHAGFQTRVAASRRFFFEEIVVLRGVLKARAR